MKFPRRGSILLAACTLAAWPSCSTDTTGLEWNDIGGSGGGTFASGGSGGDGTGGHDISGTGSASASGGAYASGGDSGTGGDTTGSGGSEAGTGGSSDTGGAVGTGGEGTGGRAGSGGAGSGGRVGTGGAATGGRGTGGAATGGHGTGGAATGGRGTGGASTGGAGTGGMPGSGGAMGTGGAVVGKPECVTAVDCRLENDCCACRAVPAGTPPSACLLFCLQTKCAQQELPPGRIDCVAGRCVAGFACDTSAVVCGQVAPPCPVGSVPTVSANGNCFSGNCAAATQCLSVDSCASCGDGNQACVTERPRDGVTSRHCVTIPTVCQGTATCGCFGPSTCVSPNTSCTNLSGVKGVSCSHP
ncbi:MAG: hypothetical protein ABIS92_07945 [Polyangia bacterium]